MEKNLSLGAYFHFYPFQGLPGTPRGSAKLSQVTLFFTQQACQHWTNVCENCRTLVLPSSVGLSSCHRQDPSRLFVNNNACRIKINPICFSFSRSNSSQTLLLESIVSNKAREICRSKCPACIKYFRTHFWIKPASEPHTMTKTPIPSHTCL